MRILLIDAGNTRIKWRLADAGNSAAALAQGTLAIDAADPAAALATQWQGLAFDRALIACVADDRILAAARAALAAAQPPQPLQAAQPPQPLQAAQTPQPTQAAQTPQPTQAAQTPQPTQAAQTPQPTQAAQTPQPTQAAQTPQPTQAEQTPQPTQAEQTPQPTQAEQTPQPTQAEQTPQPTQAEQTPQPTQAEQTPQPTQAEQTPQPTHTAQSSAPRVVLERLIPKARQCGLVNAYPEPTQLGADRWAGALGALSLHPDRVLLIATLGTATTLDLIVPLRAAPADPDSGSGAAAAAPFPQAASDRALFAGGVILPGIELMRSSLARGTARLPLASGTYRDIAINTDDAILSGILHAQLGALERLCRRARAEAEQRTPGRPALLLVGGGAATHLAALLEEPELQERLGVEIGSGDQLVLRGLARLGMEPAEPGPCT